jgi:hypothetical protein
MHILKSKSYIHNWEQFWFGVWIGLEINLLLFIPLISHSVYLWDQQGKQNEQTVGSTDLLIVYCSNLKMCALLRPGWKRTIDTAGEIKTTI